MKKNKNIMLTPLFICLIFKIIDWTLEKVFNNVTNFLSVKILNLMSINDLSNIGLFFTLIYGIYLFNKICVKYDENELLIKKFRSEIDNFKLGIDQFKENDLIQQTIEIDKSKGYDLDIKQLKIEIDKSKENNLQIQLLKSDINNKTNSVIDFINKKCDKSIDLLFIVNRLLNRKIEREFNNEPFSKDSEMSAEIYDKCVEEIKELDKKIENILYKNEH